MLSMVLNNLKDSSLLVDKNKNFFLQCFQNSTVIVKTYQHLKKENLQYLHLYFRAMLFQGVNVHSHIC